MASDAVTPDPDERGDDPLAPVVSHHAPRALIAPSPETPWPVVRVGDVAEKKLPGGLTLRALQTHDLPMVRTVIASRGGDHVYAPGLDDWAWRLAELDAAELPAFTGRNARYGFLTAGSSIGAVWWTATTREHRMMGFDGSAGNLDEQLWLLRAAVSGVRATTDKAWSKAAEAAVAKATERASPGLVAWRKRAGHLFGDGHPWTKGFYARLADHTDTPRKRIDEQLRATFTPDASIVAIVGGVPAEAAIQRARSMFFDWAPTRVQGAAGGPVAVGDAPGERGVWWVEDPGASRGEIAVTCRMSNDADDAVTRVGAAWLRHRMFGVLRESSIGAYDPAVYTGRWRELRVLEITASVSPSEAGAALEAVFADLEAARDEGPTPDEVAALAYAEAAAFALKVTDDDVVQALLIEHGTDLPAFVAGWPEALRAVQPDAIKAWLGACSGKEAATAVVPSLPSEDEPRGPASRSSR